MKRNLGFECEWNCVDCGALLQVKTFQAIVDGPGQLVICRRCDRGYTVYRDGALPVDRRDSLTKAPGLPPLPSSYNIRQPPHKIQTLPFSPLVCYVCGVELKEHQPEPEQLLLGPNGERLN